MVASRLHSNYSPKRPVKTPIQSPVYQVTGLRRLVGRLSCHCIAVALAAWPAGAFAQTSGKERKVQYTVPAAGSRDADASTHNVLAIIKKLRKSGLKREAATLSALLRRGKILHRVSGQDKKADFWSYSHNRLEYVYEHLNGHPSKGTQKFRKDQAEDQRNLYSAVLSTLHELIHKEQGETFFDASEKLRKSGVGYSAVEVEAYRLSLKKYAESILINEIESYEKKRAKPQTDRENLEKIQRLRWMIYPMRNDLSDKLIRSTLQNRYGDKLCRWAPIVKEIQALANAMDSRWLDAQSRVQCGRHMSAAARAKYELKGLQRKLKQAISVTETSIAAEEKRAAAARRQIKIEKRKAVRDKLAKEIGTADRRVVTLTRKLNRLVSKKKASHPLNYKIAVAAFSQRKAQKTLHQCRVQYVSGMHSRFKLKKSQLPRDMQLVAGKILRIRVSPHVDLLKITKRLRRLFSYSGALMGMRWLRNKKRVQTPCPKKKPAQVATPGKPPPRKTTATKPPRNQHSKLQSSGRPKPQRVAKCKKGGLAGHLDCKVVKPLSR